MFDKITMQGSKIQIVKWVLEWHENILGEQMPSKHVEWLVTEEQKKHWIDKLEKQKIGYKITDVEIPPHVSIHDNEEWVGEYSEVWEYVNGIGKYNSNLLRINELKTQLAKTDLIAL